MFSFLIQRLKAHPRKIVFTEGTDPRILEASARLLSGITSREFCGFFQIFLQNRKRMLLGGKGFFPDNFIEDFFIYLLR